MATIRCVGGRGSGKSYKLKEKCVFGRALDCDVYIADLSVSRRHAWICAVEGNRHVIEDLGSSNGTFVNEQAVRRRELRPNDLIRIGDSSFYYLGQEAPADILTCDGIDIPAEMVKQATRAPLGDGGFASDLSLEVVAREGRSAIVLESMFAVADLIANELELDRLLEKILDHLFQVFPTAERGVAFIIDRSTGSIVPQAMKQRGGAGGGLEITATGLQSLLESGEPVMVEAGFDQRATIQMPPSARHPPAPRPKGPSMAAPLICHGESLGAIYLMGSPGAVRFTEDDLALLWAIAHLAAAAITNLQASQAVLDEQRLQADLDLARRIQQSFLPQKLARIAGLDFQTHYTPARLIGGDFYDIIQLAPKRVAVLIGDVAGKGVSAALVMAKLASELRIFAHTHESPSRVLTRVNASMTDTGGDGIFATALYMVLDLDERIITFANAGHQPPIVFNQHTDDLMELDEPVSLALGVVAGTEYQERDHRLSPGEVLVLYTDGINEALNFQQEPYGMERLRGSLSRGPATPRMVIERLIGDLHRFVGSAPQSDDRTLLAITIAKPGIPDAPTEIPW